MLQIRLTADEQAALLREVHKAALATIDQSGFPHVVAMGFVAKEGVIYMTSYGKAQKVINIRRNPKVGVMVETGKSYEEFRGVLVRGHCEIIEEPAVVETIMRENLAKQTGMMPPKGAIQSASKRVVLKVISEKVSSWDHTKLHGQY
jgi:general stress protein 26